jgi:hypothetical protein
MNTRLKVLGAVLRKDTRVFWPLAALTAMLNALVNYEAIMRKLVAIEILVMPSMLLATGLFLLLVFHEDSPVTGKRDWLTRPVPGMTMLAGKCVLVGLVIVLPQVLGFVLGGFHLGRPPMEVFITSTADGLGGAELLVFLCMMAFAALTSSIRQAIVALLGSVVLFFVGLIYISGTIGYPLPLWFADSMGPASGSDWMLTRTLQLLLAFTALSVLWILYRRGHGRRAAVLLICVGARTARRAGFARRRRPASRRTRGSRRSLRSRPASSCDSRLAASPSWRRGDGRPDRDR